MHDSPPKRTSVVELAATQRHRAKVLVLFGTRPEAIKLAPVIHELEARGFDTLVVSSSQHKHILAPFVRSLDIRVDLDLRVMKKNQTPNDVFSRVTAKLDKILAAEKPATIIVQGDTTTALAGALAGFNRRIPVGHVEAGLRSGNPLSPFPEEMNRRLISQIATYHFASTDMNRENLAAENVPAESIFVTGNPVVDSLHSMLKQLKPSKEIQRLIAATNGKKRILLTTHRRESFGTAMAANLTVIRDFLERHSDVALIFPVHPNPHVRTAAAEAFGDAENIHLLDPLDYSDFLALLRASWLIVSDSGGVQEEAPSMGKPLLVIRENTERPEAIAAGVARLVGSSPLQLADALEENYSTDAWIKQINEMPNPFGDGYAAKRIVAVLAEQLGHSTAAEAERLAA